MGYSGAHVDIALGRRRWHSRRWPWLPARRADRLPARERSMNAPGSPSSALQQTYFWSASLPLASFHLRPVGKPAPPRPRRPLSKMVWMTSSGVISVRTLPQGLVSAGSDVFFNDFRIDDAAVPEGDPVLLFIEIRIFQRFDAGGALPFPYREGGSRRGPLRDVRKTISGISSFLTRA